MEEDDFEEKLEKYYREKNDHALISLLRETRNYYHKLEIIDKIRDRSVLIPYIDEYKLKYECLSLIAEHIKDENELTDFLIKYGNDILFSEEITFFNRNISDANLLRLIQCGKFKEILGNLVLKLNNGKLKVAYASLVHNSSDLKKILNSLNESDFLEYLIHYDATTHQFGKADYEKEILIGKIYKHENIMLVFKLPNIYPSAKKELLKRLKDEEVLTLYKSLKNDEDRILFLDMVESKDLIKKLIKLNLLDNKNHAFLVISNDRAFRRGLIDSIDKQRMREIDPSITFGVELEIATDDQNTRRFFYKNESILCNWDITVDGSVRSNGFYPGLEIISPVLKYDQESLKQLKIVTDFLNKSGFYTNESCGGHIHLGFDYFDTVQEFKAFTSLYGVIEDILYLISNRANTKIRQGTDRFARSNAEMISNLRIYIDNIVTKADLKAFIDRKIQDRYTGLNFTNIGKPKKNTIEFRMPNGEIDFFEVKANILLFCRLLEASKKLVHSDIETKELYDSLFNEASQDKRFEIMLKLLFPNENERSIYIERYRKNKLFTDSIPEHYNVKLYNVEIKDGRVEKVDTKKVKNIVSNFRTIRNTLNDEEIEQRNR